jgi:hypothetical protein
MSVLVLPNPITGRPPKLMAEWYPGSYCADCGGTLLRGEKARTDGARCLGCWQELVAACPSHCPSCGVRATFGSERVLIKRHGRCGQCNLTGEPLETAGLIGGVFTPDEWEQELSRC